MSHRHISPNRFAASAAATLNALPLLVSADEAVRILMQLPPRQKVWIALEQVGLPSSATAAAADHNRQGQQQQAASSSFRRTATNTEADYFDDVRTSLHADEFAAEVQPRPAVSASTRVGAITPPRPLVRSAIGPREHDKNAEFQQGEWAAAAAQQRQEDEHLNARLLEHGWNASPKPLRDTRGCFPPAAVEQGQAGQSDDGIGLIDRDVLSRVIRSPARRTNYAADAAQGGRGDNDNGVKIFRYDPRAFESGAESNIMRTPPAHVSPPRRPTPQQTRFQDEQQFQRQQPQQQPSRGFLMDRLHASMQQPQQQQQQQQQFQQQPLPEQQRFADPAAVGDPQPHHFFGGVPPPRTLGQSRAHAQSTERQPSVPVHQNRAVLLRRDSALKQQQQQQQGRNGSGGASTTTSPNRYRHVRATIQRPTSAALRDVVAPTRPGGAGPFFLSTAQHFPAVSPSRDRGSGDGFYGGTSPLREDRRGRKGIAWIV